MPQNLAITYLGHSCLLIETGRARLLLDPGNLTPPLGDLGLLDGILITHGHPDHLDADQIGRATVAGELPLYGPPDVADQVKDLDVVFTAAEQGVFEIAGVEITVVQTVHETLYAGFPLPVNLGYTIGRRVFAPGDALSAPSGEIEVLLAPLAGPWMKVSEGIDFVRSVNPSVVVPIHDAGLAPAHRALHRTLFANFGPTHATFTPLDPGQTATV